MVPLGDTKRKNLINYQVLKEVAVLFLFCLCVMGKHRACLKSWLEQSLSLGRLS